MPDKKQNNDKSLVKQPVTANTLLWLVSIALGCFIMFQIYQIATFYGDVGKNAIKEGKKVVIKVEGGEIEGLSLSEDEIKSFNPEYAAKLEEKKAEEERKKAEEQAKLEEQKRSGVIPGDYSKANLGIIVTEVGQTKGGIDLLKKLPKEVSVAFSPYSDELQKKIDFQKREGREILLNLVLEPSGFPVIDTGPLTILTASEPSRNLTKLENVVGENKDFIGFLAIRGEVVTHNLDAISPILKKIKDMNMFFGFNKVSVNAYLETEVKPMAVDIFIVDYQIDEMTDEKSILSRLSAAKQDIISRKKRVVISLRPYKNSVEILKKWLDKNLGENIQIAPISYFVTNN